MMHDREKSDPPIVAMKSANKPAHGVGLSAPGVGAESMERRGGAKGNVLQMRTYRTQCRVRGMCQGK